MLFTGGQQQCGLWLPVLYQLVIGLQQAAGSHGRRVGAGQQRSGQESGRERIPCHEAGTAAAAQGTNLCYHRARQCSIQAHEYVQSA